MIRILTFGVITKTNTINIKSSSFIKLTVHVKMDGVSQGRTDVVVLDHARELRVQIRPKQKYRNIKMENYRNAEIQKYSCEKNQT